MPSLRQDHMAGAIPLSTGTASSAVRACARERGGGEQMRNYNNDDGSECNGADNRNEKYAVMIDVVLF